MSDVRVSDALEQLIPGRRQFDGADMIFTMNAAAQQRAAAGVPVINATVGALLDDGGKLVVLDTVMAHYRQLTPMEIAPYAPIAGDPEYLLALTQRHWPEVSSYGVGAATPGGTGALALSLRNLLEPGQRLLTAAPYWGPYATLALENRVVMDTVPYPAAGRSAGRRGVACARRGHPARAGAPAAVAQRSVPQPDGAFSLSTSDRRALLQMLREVATLGPVTLLLDFAYLDYARDA